MFLLILSVLMLIVNALGYQGGKKYMTTSKLWVIWNGVSCEVKVLMK